MMRRTAALMCAAASSTTFSSNYGNGFGFESPLAAAAAAAEAAAAAKLPTRESYEAMSDDELNVLIKTKDRQISELRRIYENFHYEVDKRFKTMIFDYHDKALSMSKVHGDMQMSSLTINREALQRMRERDEARNRDRRLVQVLCFLATLFFWLWLRRHYVVAKQNEDPRLVKSVGGMGFTDNFFGSVKRSGRYWDTPYEREVRAEKEAAAAAAAGAAEAAAKVVAGQSAASGADDTRLHSNSK